MGQENNDNQVSEFMANIVTKLPYFLDNKIMDSFDVQFEYKGERYQLALIKNGKVNGVDFKLSLN